MVDESMLTGEPDPVEKKTDASVVGGTLNGKGAFVFRATQVGADTVLAQIVRMVEEAQSGKPPIQRVADPLRPESAQTIDSLHKMGLKIAMLTGDGQATAEAIARQTGIDSVIAEVLPDQKLAEIKRLQDEGHKVAFVGDGINDAPALAQSDVGIAIGTGTNIAVEAGDVILMSGNLSGIVKAILLARRTLGIIHGNFFWAHAYNVALIPVAAGVLFPWFHILLNPMLAAGAMSLSSVFMVTNSLRLRRFKSTSG